MEDNVKQFSIDDIQLFRTDEDVDFMHAKIYALGEGNNSHKNPIDISVLERDKDTILGKLLIAKFDRFEGDVTTHVPDQSIIGYIPPNQEAKIEEKDGKRFITVDGLISKIYATDVARMFRDGIGQREVSCEFSCQEGEEDENGDSPILAFHIHGITLLGLRYHASSKGAELKIMQFAEECSIKESNLKSFAEKRMKKLEEEKLVSHPMDKSKEALDTSSWDGDKAKHDLIKEKNYKTLAKSVCLDLREGWEDRKITALGYPVMNLKGGKWVYNKNGLDSADSYSEQHDPQVQKEVTKIKKKLGLLKEESMAREEKKLSDEDTKDVVMEQDESKVDDKKEEKEMAKPTEDKAKDEEEKEMGCDKTFSLDAYVDSGAMLALLEAETDIYKGLANKVLKEMSAEDIVMEFVKVSKERDDMKAEKNKAEQDKKDKKFMAIMAEYKEQLSTDNFVKLYEEGKALKFEQLDGFVNKIKSFAEEKEEKTNDGIMKFAGVDNSSNNETKDVWDRISNK